MKNFSSSSSYLLEINKNLTVDIVIPMVIEENEELNRKGFDLLFADINFKLMLIANNLTNPKDFFLKESSPAIKKILKNIRDQYLDYGIKVNKLIITIVNEEI